MAGPARLRPLAPSEAPVGAGAVDAGAVAEGPLLSVLMPTHDSDPRWLARAVASVRAQRYANWELCIADDASSEPAVREILRSLEPSDARIRVAYRSTRGHISAASNTALSLVRGPFVALLDHDDELAPDALLQVAAALRREPGHGPVCTPTRTRSTWTAGTSTSTSSPTGAPTSSSPRTS